jgi:hypothetical protein
MPATQRRRQNPNGTSGPFSRLGATSSDTLHPNFMLHRNISGGYRVTSMRDLHAAFAKYFYNALHGQYNFSRDRPVIMYGHL